MVFNFFLFGKKDDLVQRHSLKKVPLFASLSDVDLNYISKRVRLVVLSKGDIVYRQGDTPEAFYIILSGRCRVFIHTSKNEERNLAYLGKGDYFGEVSLLTEKSHAANVEVKNDAMILKISKKDFFSLIHDIPALSLQISRRLGVRIKKLYEPDSFQANTKIVSLLSLPYKEIKTNFAYNFAASLKTETKKKVLLVDLSHTTKAHQLESNKKADSVSLKELSEKTYNELQGCIAGHEAGFHLITCTSEEDDVDIKKIATLLTELLIDYHYLLVNLPEELTEITSTILEQSDSVYILSDFKRESVKKCQMIVDTMRSRFNLSPSEMRIILNEIYDANSKISIAQVEHIVGWKVFFILPGIQNHKEENDPMYDAIVEQTTAYGKAVRYLARELGGVLVGLVLGSGAAFGLAHIGVLKVLEEENIPIDIVSGSSIGAVFGALWAAGYNASDLEKIALSFRHKRNLYQLVNIFDLSVPYLGFFKGNQVKRFLSKLVGKKEFKDLRLPLRIVATDLITSEDVVFKEGKLIDAIRASISIPGVFRPMRFQERHLIDGGVTNPLPVNLLTEEGAHKIIAVNVLPSTENVVEMQMGYREKQAEYQEALKKEFFLKKIFYRITQMIEKRYTGNIFNALMNTVQYLEAAVSSMQQSEADIIIHPFVCDSHWAQFYSPQKFIDCGEEKTKEAIDEIKRIIEE